MNNDVQALHDLTREIQGNIQTIHDAEAVLRPVLEWITAQYGDDYAWRKAFERANDIYHGLGYLRDSLNYRQAKLTRLGVFQ